MDEAKSRIRLRAVLGLLAAVVAVAAFWVTSAFAADGSAANDRSSSDSPAAQHVQNDVQSDGSLGADRDGNCPNRDGESNQSSDA